MLAPEPLVPSKSIYPPGSTRLPLSIRTMRFPKNPPWTPATRFWHLRHPMRSLLILSLRGENGSSPHLLRCPASWLREFCLRCCIPGAHSTVGATPDVKTNSAVRGHPVRALLGKGRQAYTDHAGNTWTPGNYCTGGVRPFRTRPADCGHRRPGHFSRRRARPRSLRLSPSIPESMRCICSLQKLPTCPRPQTDLCSL